MTEAEWLEGAELVHMEHYVRSRASGRKKRLFACACCRQLERWFPDAALHSALARAEQFADGELSAETLRKWRRRVERVASPLSSSSPDPAVRAAKAVCNALEAVCDPADDGGFYAWWVPVVDHRYKTVCDPDSTGYRVELPRILRDIFGNPFRPVASVREWRNDTVLSLAKGMHEGRDYSAMPILADALQDAGCDCGDVLSHCRDEKQPHVRGCWVVDLMLGKQ